MLFDPKSLPEKPNYAASKSWAAFPGKYPLVLQTFEKSKKDKKETTNSGSQQRDHTHSEEKSSGSIYLGNIIIYFLAATGIYRNLSCLIS